MKALGDLAEQLRTASERTAAEVAATNVEARQFIQNGLITSAVDPARADELADRYAAICADADELQNRYREIEKVVDKPAVRRALARQVALLEQIKLSSKLMIELLELVRTSLPPPPPSDL